MKFEENRQMPSDILASWGGNFWDDVEAANAALNSRPSDAPGSVDILALCADDEMRRLMNDAENAINYHDGTNEERAELIFYRTERLKEGLGARIGYDSLLSGYGAIYKLAAEGTVADKPRIDEFEALGSFSYGILLIDPY